LTAESKRPADVGLFHELVHAWYYVSGRQIFTDDNTENERMVIGLPGFNVRATGHQRLYTENRYRDERGMGPRLSI
jgi:NleD-like pathogen effector protein (putative zinc metallopeptidase)